MITKLNIFIYGEPGAGKTHLLNSLDSSQHVKKALLLDFDHGADLVITSNKITILKINSVYEIEKFCEELNKKDGKFSPFDTIIIDTFTEMASVSMDEVAPASVKIIQRRSDQDRIEQLDYSINGKRMTRLCRALRNCDKNIILTGHAKTVYPKGANGVVNKDAEPIEYLPRLSGELCTAVLGFMDYVFFIVEKNAKHLLINRGVDEIYTKLRGKIKENLKPVIEDPNLGEIIDNIFKIENEDK